MVTRTDNNTSETYMGLNKKQLQDEVQKPHIVIPAHTL